MFRGGAKREDRQNRRKFTGLTTLLNAGYALPALSLMPYDRVPSLAAMFPRNNTAKLPSQQTLQDLPTQMYPPSVGYTYPRKVLNYSDIRIHSYKK